MADSDVKLLLRSETDAHKVAETCWTCFQHLLLAPSTLLPAGSMKEHSVGLESCFVCAYVNSDITSCETM